jgi:uncharacterized protein
MKLNIREIPEEGLTLDLAVDEKTVTEVLGEGSGGQKFSLLSPVKAHLNLSIAGSMVRVEGSLQANLSLNCSRCLKDFTYVAGPVFSLYFVKGGENQEEREKELAPEDLEINYLEGDILDTTDLILEQLALDLNMQPLCKKDCKGLCPRCGSDLNMGSCGCKKEERIDPRFASLKDFKVK